jgi:Na+:H+ antiporter, NhaA family
MPRHSPIVSSAKPTFIQSDRVLARLARPINRFMHVEAAGGVVLLVATAAALVWANSPWRASYVTVWSTEIEVHVGRYVLAEDLRHWVNDALMAIFFFVVGMEIKREMVVGELRDRRAVALPAIAALGGMIVPALIYVGFTVGTDGASGWAIPMATDIAFAIGVLALLGSRIPAPLKVFLLTLAIVDDLGAITIIAVFYSDHVQPRFLIVAAALGVGLALMRRAHVVYPPLYILIGLALWLAVYASGVHATIAGVVVGLLTPARPLHEDLDVSEVATYLEHSPGEVGDVRAAARAIRESVSPCDRLIDVLHPWSSYFIVPVFALANAGIVLTMDAVTNPSAVMLGVLVGLVVGKTVGVAGASWLAIRLGIARMPDGVSTQQLVGVAALAGIGFTVSLFITDLAFGEGPLAYQAKVGILIGSATAAVIGVIILLLGTRRAPA